MSSNRSTLYNDEEIVEFLRRADRMVGERLPVNQICYNLGISRSSYYRWQRRFGVRGPVAEMVRTKQRVAALEREIDKRDVQIDSLRIAAEGN